MTKMFSRRRCSRKLIRCLALIRRKSEAFFTGKKSEEARSRLEELPDDVMQLILQRLPLSDYLNCRYISPRWRAAIDSKRWLPAAHHQLPWLVTTSRLGSDMLASYIKADDDDDDDDDYLRIVINRKICYPEKDFITHYCCVGSIAGWLIITNFKTFAYVCNFFCNSVSGARIKLPSHCISDRYFASVKMVASSVPTIKECYVTCLHFEHYGQLAFCTPTSESWTKIVAEKDLLFPDIEILDGKLYAVGSNVLEFLMVFYIHFDTHSRIRTYSSLRLVTLHPNVNNIVDYSNLYRTCYLAKCCESKDLFMVLYQSNGFEKSFQVLKLEYKDVGTSPQWVEITDLGDRTLFIGTRNNKFITCHDETLERNCIYFVLSQGSGDKYTSGVFSLIDRSFKPITHPHIRRFSTYNHSIWFTPNPC